MPMNTLFQVSGYIGSGITVIMFVPQVNTTFTKKTTKGLSINFVLLNLLCSIFWCIYGIGFLIENDILNMSTILLPNIITGCCSLLLLSAFKLFPKEECLLPITN